jgi:hypothetical protein
VRCAGIPELVRLLQQRGVRVFLVSGGFHQVIDPLADQLGIPRSHVYANTILYNVRAVLLGCFRSTWDLLARPACLRWPGLGCGAACKVWRMCCRLPRPRVGLNAYRGKHNACLGPSRAELRACVERSRTRSCLTAVRPALRCTCKACS